MSLISDNLNEVRSKIEMAAKKSNRTLGDVSLIAVTKTHSADMINEAIENGVTDIGENKVQEIIEKYDYVKKVRWHLIGHLQTNKVKYIIDKVHMIHSVDSIRLMDEIERQAQKHNVTMNILIQVNISGEESKFGINPDELEDMLLHAGELKNVKVCGLMTILPKIDTEISLRLHFVNIKRIFIDNSNKNYHNVDMKYLSMGMSGDYEIAIEEGSNMVRVGRAIFGERNYI